MNACNLNIAGVTQRDPNRYLDRLRSSPWTHIPALLGKEGERVLTELYEHCGLFESLKEDGGALIQVSGVTRWGLV